LGIVFFFVLAINRGLIGPEVRIVCGALASGLVVGAGFWLRSRQGESYAALAAVGSGIAGGYATVLAAAGLYDLVSDTAALVVAASIATVGVATSLIWSAQPVAGLGLVGAMGVPVLIGLGGGGLTLLERRSSALCSPRLPWSPCFGGGVTCFKPASPRASRKSLF
jgi:uncharacterized membrane protein